MPRTQSWGTAPYGPDNPEFEARVRSAVGSPYYGAVDKSRATRLPGDFAGLLGFYTVPGNSTEYLLNASPNKYRYQSLLDWGVPVEADRVYVSNDDATTQTWAHEFRHRAKSTLPGPHDNSSEGGNRLLDAYYAGSRPQWNEAVKFWGEWRKLKPEEAEADLVQALRNEEMGFTSMPEFSEEWKASRGSGWRSWGPSQAIRGLLDPAKADAVKKVNAPWRNWVTPGLLTE